MHGVKSRREVIVDSLIKLQSNARNQDEIRVLQRGGNWIDPILFESDLAISWRESSEKSQIVLWEWNQKTEEKKRRKIWWSSSEETNREA